jgi:MoxR-like ATPase
MNTTPATIDETAALLKSRGYIAGRDLATVVFLSLRMGRPLFLEGEAGVGKTEIAKVVAEGLGRELIRLQCYEGLDVNSAVYEWNYAAQMIEIRLAEASGELNRERLGQDIFAEKFLIKRALLQALDRRRERPRFCSSTRSTAPTKPLRRSSSKCCRIFR